MKIRNKKTGSICEMFEGQLIGGRIRLKGIKIGKYIITTEKELAKLDEVAGNSSTGLKSGVSKDKKR